MSIRGILLGAICCVLALTTSAHAECAWVLWAYDNTGKAKWTWSVTEGYPTALLCFQQRNEWQKNVKNLSAPDGNLTPEMLFRCFPDTVDPREPKRGER